MLINLWYVAEWSDTVGQEPVRVKMLGQQFVLFRDEAGKETVRRGDSPRESP